ncbi:class I adenylate-forming enzyme family protein [Agromyces sp. MMS24-K17]|uniref:class I adenylate-forming enzyme family protein n=1 Tax=Agromyces sp. MMS24-K17 TaxID=3372850 RepID=UPI00375447DD
MDEALRRGGRVRVSDWLRGPRDAVALAFGGDVVRTRDLARAVSAARLPAGDGAVPVAVPAGTDPVTAITVVLTCLERGRPVLVGGTDAQARHLAPALPEGTALALLTSGSTDASATPRAVARTEASWLASAEPLAELAGVGAGDRVAVTGPLHVSMHLYAALHALWAGATVVDRLDDATVVHATPTRLARLLDGASVPATAVVAGAVLGDVERRTAEARGIRLVEYYGAAELSFVAVGDGDDLVPFPGVELDLRPAPTGLEVWARSPYLALGVIGGGMLRRDADGFATVGDLAEIRPSGAIRILGRGDAAITTAGCTVIAEDLEARLRGLPGVAAAAVLGEPHDLLGERIVAVVELDGTVDGLAAVITAARASLEPALVPRRWFAAALPRTDAGKVARGVLRAAIADGSLGAGHPIAGPPAGVRA